MDLCINHDLCTVSFDVRYAESKGPSTNASPLLSLTPTDSAFVKTIAQGRPECSRCPVCSCAFLFVQIARETAGAASTRSSLRPLRNEGEKNYTKLGRVPPRESGPMPHAVEILNQGLALHERAHATVQCSTSSMVAGLPFWSRGCGRLPVVTCSTECSKASPHFWIERHV